jgi:glycosyltransferase involved in cell wall biosynthesis
MRIAIDARELEGNPTGAGRFLLEILRRWPRSVFTRHQIFLYFKGSVPVLSALDGLPFERVRCRPGFLARYDILWEQLLLPFYLAWHKADVFWGANGACSFISLRAIKKIVSIYDLTYLINKNWYSPRERFVWQCRFHISVWAADHFLTISESTANDIGRYSKETAIRPQIVGPGIEHLNGRVVQSNKKSNEMRILFVGSLLNRRPVENLIGAIKHLVGKYPHLRLRIVGDNRTFPKRDFPSLVRELRLENYIHIYGYLGEEALAQIYRESDIFCYPSLHEGFGIPLIEAQYYGLPVVTLKNSSLAEVGQDSVFYAVSEKSEHLASALDALLSNTVLYKDLAEKGLRNVSRFSWNNSAQAVLTFLERAVI